MAKKELIIELIKLDRFLINKSKKLAEILNAESCNLIIPGEGIKEISDIIFDFVGIPEENLSFYDDIALSNAYSRDAVFSLYYDGVFARKISIEKLIEMLLEIGENNGEFKEKHIKFTKTKLDWTWRGQ